MIDFKQPLTDFDGKEIPAENGPLTLEAVCQNALLVSYPDERNLTGEEKTKRGLLAMRIHAGSLELTSDEVTLCKTMIGKAYGPLVVLRAWQILDPASVK